MLSADRPTVMLTSTALEDLEEGFSKLGRRWRNADARCFHRCNLVLGAAFAARDDRSCVTHAPTRRRARVEWLWGVVLAVTAVRKSPAAGYASMDSYLSKCASQEATIDARRVQAAGQT